MCDNHGFGLCNTICVTLGWIWMNTVKATNESCFFFFSPTGTFFKWFLLRTMWSVSFHFIQRVNCNKENSLGVSGGMWRVRKLRGWKWKRKWGGEGVNVGCQQGKYFIHMILCCLPKCAKMGNSLSTCIQRWAHRSSLPHGWTQWKIKVGCDIRDEGKKTSSSKLMDIKLCHIWQKKKGF